MSKKNKRSPQQGDSSQQPPANPPTPSTNLPAENPRGYQQLQQADQKGGGGLFSRFNQRFNDALQQGRGGAEAQPAARPAPASAPPQAQQQPYREAARDATPRNTPDADDIALRRAGAVKARRMIIPEGVLIEGSLTGGADSEIFGKIDGNVTVEGRLLIGQGGQVLGNVRASACSVDGLVEGRIETEHDCEVGQQGKTHGDIVAGRRIDVAGEVFGNAATAGTLRLASTAQLRGDVRVRRLVMEEGAVLNGSSTMRAPAQKKEPGDPSGQRAHAERKPEEAKKEK